MVKMKGLIGLFIVLIMTGCSVNKYVNTSQVKEFKKDIRKAYEFIDSIQIYKMSGPNTLFIQYVSIDEVDSELAQKCFETTKNWITQKSNLEAIESYLTIKISKISIRISSPRKYDNWEASYYKHEPNESITKKNPVDNFETWYYWEYVKDETSLP